VPDDVAIIGFDNHPTAELMDLSTIRQPVREQALDVATRLLASVTAGVDSSEDLVLPTELIVRGSTDPARTVY
jgi:DNA-binding LacI/PurR family transcriptional regulator